MRIPRWRRRDLRPPKLRAGTLKARLFKDATGMNSSLSSGCAATFPFWPRLRRRRVVNLWRWARKQGYLPRDAMAEAEQTHVSREDYRDNRVISAAIQGDLLSNSRGMHPEYLAPVVIAGFRGLRRAVVPDEKQRGRCSPRHCSPAPVANFKS